MKAKGGLNLKLNTSSQVEISKDNEVSNLIIFLTVRTQPHSNAINYRKSCQKLISQEGSIGAKQIICDSEGPVTSTKLTVGIFLSSNSMGVIAI